jgi:dTDP-4-amino-4,6-dideoxygalactose transaminase
LQRAGTPRNGGKTAEQGSVARMTIPLFDTPGLVEELRPELDERMRAVVDSGQFILAERVEAFEREFAHYLGVRHVVGVANGTDALTIALRALGVGPGDDVVVPSFTFYASAETVAALGATPVFCDVDEDTLVVTAETVEAALTSRTRVVMPVHLFGTPAPMEELGELARKKGFSLLEDAAQSAGASLNGRRTGSFGDAATYSFFPTKNLFCLGDGGAIATNDDNVMERADLLRRHGSPDGKKTFVEVGYNSRLDELQAAVLSLGLTHLDDWTARRRELAAAYVELGIGDLVSLQTGPPGAQSAHHMYVVRTPERDPALQALVGAGIGARPAYHHAVHEQPAMRPFAEGVDLPATRRVVETCLALPMAPTRTADDARAVVEVLRQALNSA